MADIKGKRICVDSRSVREGDLFFALPGERVDGHVFLEDVAKRGACAAYVSESYTGKNYGIPLIYVEDVLGELQRLAQEKIERYQGKIVAITGSLGKTSCKEFLKTLLSEKYTVFATVGNQNSQIGLPLTILNDFRGDEDVMVLEMGMTHPGQISRLIEIAPPDIAVITMTTLAHAENFESVREITLVKGEILTHPKTELGIINGEIEHIDELCQMGACEKVLFSVDKDGERFDPLPVQGKQHLHNFIPAALAAKKLGLSWEEIKQGATKLKLPERRMEVVERCGVTFVNDSYNACEMSVKAALSNLPNPKLGRKKIAVLAEMPELGKFSEECHRKVGEYSLNHVDMMLCLGEACHPIVDCWKEGSRPVFISESREELVEILNKEMAEGDVVLLKGANSKQMWKVLELIE